MVIQPRRFWKRDGSGFTLLEVLLSVALLMALLAAVVFNFESVRRGADLEEGTRQFQALVKFASAQAANNGRAVQFRFGEPPAGTNDMVDPVLDFDSEPKLRVLWEVDPVEQPGVFEDLPEAASFVESLADHVRVENVTTPGRPANQSTNEMALEEVSAELPAVTFYPDGSSDTAEIILSSRESEDYRRAKIFLEGVTGGMRSRIVDVEDFIPVEWMGAEGEETPPNPSETAPANSTLEMTPMPDSTAPDQPLEPTEPATKDPIDEEFP